MHTYDRRGVRLQTSHDRDQDGLVERLDSYSPDGTLAAAAHDGDGDQRYERVQEFHPWGARVWIDSDRDGRFDRVEERERDDAILRTWRIEAGGFVLER
jgi:hypothetical protein